MRVKERPKEIEQIGSGRKEGGIEASERCVGGSVCVCVGERESEKGREHASKLKLRCLPLVFMALIE